MELAEAVRILRDQTIPALRAMWRDWYPVHVAALEAVLAAPAPAQRERYEALSVTSKEGLLASEWVARTGRAEAEVARLRAQWDAGVLAGIRATAEQQGQIVALTGEVERLRLDLEIAEPKKSAAVMALAARAERAGAALKATQDMLREEEEQRRLARIAAEAERDALWAGKEIGNKLLAGRDRQIVALRADLSRTLAEVERLRAVLEQISGSGTVDGADARALLGDTASTCRCGHSMEAHRCAEPGCKRGCHANDGSDGPCDCALRDPAPLPTSQPARAIEVCKRAATAPAAQPLDARAHAGDGESAQRELATAPAEGFFARGDDGHYHPDPAPAEEEKLKFWGASRPCETAEEPSCPHGHPPGSARDCACREKL
jgi:hypothetical protein